MRVPDGARKSVLFLGDKTTGGFTPRGTAFVVSLTEGEHRWHYLVTAEHVVSGMVTRGYDVWLRTNLESGGSFDSKIPYGAWHFHPESERVPTDVAVCPIELCDDEDIRATGLDIAATKELIAQKHIGLGDEVAIIGLFRQHHGKQRNLPIVRVGNIALLTSEPVWTRYCGYTDAYLIVARSINGLSGSPVFVTMPPFRANEGKVEQHIGPVYWLLGLVHGHFDVDRLHEDAVVDDGNDGSRGINAGIGIVIPVEKILETIHCGELVAERKQMTLEASTIIEGGLGKQ